jgi:hypothetical protein
VIVRAGSARRRPNLQNPENPLPLLDTKNPPRIKGGGG